MAKADAVGGDTVATRLLKGASGHGMMPPGNAGVPPAPYLARLGQTPRRQATRKATVPGWLRKGRMRFMPGNHSPLEKESQKPSRMAKADAVGGTRRGRQAAACTQSRPPLNHPDPPRKQKPQSIPSTLKESRSSNSSTKALGTGGKPARSAMLDVSYRARTLSSTPT